MFRQFTQFSVPPIVFGRILAIMFLLTIAAMYFVGENLGLIPPIFAEEQTTPEERRALAKHNAEVKRLIAARQARANAVRAADRADLQAQISRDAPTAPVAVAQPTSAPEPVVTAATGAP